MKKTGIIAIIIIIAIVGFWGVGAYNGLVNSQEDVESQWANVEDKYQRRADLIPNLISTVKGYAKHEKETLEGVINARAKATQTKIDPKNLTPETLAKFQSAQGELSSALGRLLLTVERYPDLKANENFMDLQKQLEGTENRISTERTRFNEVAKTYNKERRQFPKSIVANLFGFSEKPYFKAAEGSEKVPEVDFN